MANVIYPEWKQALIEGSANIALSSGTVKAVLLDATYTYTATDTFLSDIAAGERVAISEAFTGKTTENGLFDATDGVTFTSVTGDQATQLAIFIDTGVESTSRLVAFYDDSVTGLPLTPNGGNVTLNFNASGIFQL